MFYAFSKIEKIRNRLLHTNLEIDHKDFGAGSMHKNATRKICDLAKHSAKNRKYGELLYRLVNWFQPKTILELGTSLGISGMYMSSANKGAKFISIEANAGIAAEAEKNFLECGLINYKLINGTFEDKLNEAVLELGKLDFVFFDGNHRKEATLSYFNHCLQHSDAESVFVFDDIHWSSGMEEAWNEIKLHPKVYVTIDLFFMGLVFFRSQQAKENFIVRF